MHEPAEEARPQPAPHRSADRHAQPVDLEQLAEADHRDEELADHHALDGTDHAEAGSWPSYGSSRRVAAGLSAVWRRSAGYE